jgi:hypothetical protein
MLLSISKIESPNGELSFAVIEEQADCVVEVRPANVDVV